jgi:poly(3-hydroxybutyrate) depolymerase
MFYLLFILFYLGIICSLFSKLFNLNIPYFGGNSDPSIPPLIAVGNNYPSTKESIDFFILRNDCNKESSLVLSKGDMNCFLYSPCLSGTEVEVCISLGAGHAWPGTVDSLKGTPFGNYVGTSSKDINANDLMWEFFKKHPLN